MGWIGEGKLGIVIELMALGGYVKLLKKNWSKMRSWICWPIVHVYPCLLKI
jgi:hypothetical protein